MFPYLQLILLYNLVPTEAMKPKSVNLALETILEFDNKNVESDIQIIDNVQKFLTKVRSVLGKPNYRRNNRKDHLKFTEFLQNAILLVETYDDNDLQALINIIDGELRKYHYKGCKFYELVQNGKIRRGISNALDDIKAAPIRRVRRFLEKIKKYLQDKKFTDEELNFISYIDSLYQSDDTEKMYNILKSLEYYKSRTKRSNLDLLKIVRDGVRSIIFEHYSNLNPNVRKDLRMKIATYFIEYSSKGNKILNAGVMRFTTEYSTGNIEKEIENREGQHKDLRSESKTTDKETERDGQVIHHVRESKTTNKDIEYDEQGKYYERERKTTHKGTKNDVQEANNVRENKSTDEETETYGQDVHSIKESKITDKKTEIEGQDMQFVRERKTIDNDTESELEENHNVQKYLQSRYISLYPEEITRKPKTKKPKLRKPKSKRINSKKPKMKNKKSKKKSSHKHDLHLIFEETKISKPRFWDKKSESVVVVKENKPLKELLTEHKAVFKVDRITTEDRLKHVNKSDKRSKHSKKHKLSHAQRYIKTSAPAVSPMVKIEPVSTDEGRKSVKDSMEGIPIASFEYIDIAGHYKNRKKFDEMKTKRSVKRKEEILRRRLQNLRTKIENMETDEPRTDKGYIIGKINSLEKQIEHMNRRIDIVGFTADLRKSQPDSLGNNIEKKTTDIPFWTGFVTNNWPITVSSTMKTTVEELIYDIKEDTAQNLTTVTAKTKTVSKPYVKATYKDIDGNVTIKSTTLKTSTTTAVLTPEFRSQDNLNETDHGYKDLKNFANADNMKSKLVKNVMKGEFAKTDKIEKTLVKDNKTKIIENKLIVKVTTEKIDEDTKITNETMKVQLDSRSKNDVIKSNVTTTTEKYKTTNLTGKPPGKATVLTTRTALNANLKQNDTTISNVENRDEKRSIFFLSPPYNTDDNI